MTVECKHPGCDGIIRRAGYCGAHQLRKLSGRDMDAPLRKNITPKDRFYKKVDKTDGCWLWIGSKDPKGYGTFRHEGRTTGAHRVAWAWERGSIPVGMELDHLCHTPACVNPTHLRLATHFENSQNRNGAYSNSKSGVRGVYWRAENKRWQAKAIFAGAGVHLGYHSSAAEAEKAVTEWRRTHMPYSLMDQKKAE